MKLFSIVFLAVGLFIGLSIEAFARPRKSACTTIEAAGSYGVTEEKAKYDARVAWRTDAASQVSAEAADNMKGDTYKCKRVGSGVLRNVNWQCRIRAQACPQDWAP
ncbi:MAG: hypothetical protein Q7T86_03170 [Hyphomicrobiaceae bacterium]|nr:hypothetical protein [Hyphomicrobiaceae bacterium]